MPTQLLYMGLVGTALAIVGFIKLWRTATAVSRCRRHGCCDLRAGLRLQGKVYYTDGVAAAVLAAGTVAAERWIACARRPRLLRDTVLAVILVTTAVILFADLPIVPVGDVHAADLKPAQRRCREHRRLAAARPRSGRTGRGPLPDRPAADMIFTGWYAEAAALNVLGSADHLPPVLSGHNAYWMWAPGRRPDPGRSRPPLPLPWRGSPLPAQARQDRAAGARRTVARSCLRRLN